MTSSWLAKTAAICALAGASCAWAVDQPPRWIKADDLRVRAGPGMDQRVSGMLQRGSEVILKSPEAFDGFCLIEGDGQYGYVACQYLSAEPISRPRAGQDGVPPDRRWITGTAVNLRAAAARDAEIVSRLSINRAVQLVRADVGIGFCEVQPLDRAGKPEGASGFTACQYLAVEALPAAQAAAIDGDPARTFWRSPGWWKLEAYAQSLVAKLPESAKYGPWPRDEELERMKAHLALGLKAPPPKPLPDWSALKALAAAHDPAILGTAQRAKARSGKDKELWRREYRASSAAHQIGVNLGLSGPLHDSISSDGGGERVMRLMLALEMPTVRPSLFRTEAEVGPPGEGPEALAGRFGGIYRTVVAPRKPQRPDGSTTTGAGLYDMFSRTVSLTRPVLYVQLYRDGTLKSEATNTSATEVLWRDVDGPECEGWTPGFGFGDVDGPIWRYFDQPGNELPQPVKRAAGPPRLFAYKALQAPPRSKATRSEQVVKLDRAATGFSRFTQMGFDLDEDGVPDLMVLEGAGPGPGHLGGTTQTDDPWYRLLLVNLGGAWKVLSSDSFSYGCGC
ncbi:SH3 domain-containing protein [Roseateles amylovorans]|uniref:SH3 domain-containing protein n=1 Tax=Roseateles amylovorans TaxID=2978473 RepID=A0ABY6AV88_9BURK|nr:hypothetical protein [Roseateles amylovorans]UXH76705.1 hypothetical protein N4261_16880 [Roseateles amylovorans]